jgi:hypothetical protein
MHVGTAIFIIGILWLVAAFPLARKIVGVTILLGICFVIYILNDKEVNGFLYALFQVVLAIGAIAVCFAIYYAITKHTNWNDEPPFFPNKKDHK